MSVARINVLNMLLVVVSLAAAFSLPFEVFLFSYAVLGPLHYLTQISWMHERKYFTRSGSPFDWGLLATLAIAVTVVPWAVPAWSRFNPNLAFTAFGAALLFVLFKDLKLRLVGLLLLLPFSWGAARWEHFPVAFAGLLPTIIHVCVFTAAFVLVGALKSKDRTGLGLLGVYAACAAACFLVVPDVDAYAIGETARQTYDESFYGLNVTLSHMLLAQPFTELEQVFSSSGGLMIARFIAFSYTYHYLNWFSKTSVIRWHDVPKGRLVLCVVLWIVSLGVYAWDFRVGVASLGLLSRLHVYLEFPLDHLTFMTIGKEGAALVRGGGPARA